MMAAVTDAKGRARRAGSLQRSRSSLALFAGGGDEARRTGLPCRALAEEQEASRRMFAQDLGPQVLDRLVWRSAPDHLHVFPFLEVDQRPRAVHEQRLELAQEVGPLLRVVDNDGYQPLGEARSRRGNVIAVLEAEAQPPGPAGRLRLRPGQSRRPAARTFYGLCDAIVGASSSGCYPSFG
jgi:hypothetical protein